MHESQESGLMNTYKLNMPCELIPQSPSVVPPETSFLKENGYPDF